MVDFRQEQESRDNLNKDVDSEVNEDCANHSQTEKVLDLNRINKVCEYEKLIGWKKDTKLVEDLVLVGKGALIWFEVDQVH